MAGWKRGKLPPNNHFGDIQVTIAEDFRVPPTIRSGVFVETESTEKLEVLKAMPALMLPQHIKAAQMLKLGLSTGLDPPQDDLTKPLAVGPGDSMSVWILVGKKP
jgi:hypothetical protein